MDKEVELILTKLRIVSEIEESGAYICDKEHSKILYDYITNLQEQLHQASLDIQELTEKDIGCPSWCDKLTNLQEEIEKLNDLLNKTNDELVSYVDECIRLNNIIDELERWLEENDKQLCLRKLRALKEGKENDK